MAGIINGIPVPIAVIRDFNLEDIVFYNYEFIKTFANYENNFSLGSLIDLKALENILRAAPCETNKDENFLNLSYDGKKIKLYAKRIDDFVVLYFLDNTAYRWIKKKYLDSRICVGLILFDNKEELKRYATEEQSSQISVSVENTLREWIKSADGIFRKLSDEKYFVVFEEK